MDIEEIEEVIEIIEEFKPVVMTVIDTYGKDVEEIITRTVKAQARVLGEYKRTLIAEGFTSDQAFEIVSTTKREFDSALQTLNKRER